MKLSRSGLVVSIISGSGTGRDGCRRGKLCWSAAAITRSTLFFFALLVSLAFGGVAGFQEYIIPGQETLLRANYASIDSDPAVGNAMHAVISITASTDGTIVNYDHWENGYGTPDETVTLNTGQNHIFESANIPTSPRGTGTYYDGGDRISVIGGPAAVSRASWPESPGVVMATGFELLPVQALRTTFEMPAGTDLNQNTRDLPFADFQRVVLMVQSVVDNNAITIYQPDGTTVIWSGTLNKGESVTSTALQNVLKGTSVVGSGRIQVQFLTGRAVTGTGSQINGYSGIPTTLWSNRYHSPTPSFVPTATNSRTDIYLFNPNPAAITVSYQDSTSGSFTIDPDELVSFRAETGHYVPVNSGVSFTGTGTFWGFSEVGTGFDTFDWGGILIPDEFARSNYVIGWAPGSLDLSQNYSAVYVMALGQNTTVNVDYNQDQAIDQSYNLSFPQLQRITDASDRDMTGARIWGTDSLVMTFGEISGSPTNQASPALDLGYTVIPLVDEFTDAVLSLEKSVSADTAGIGQSMTFSLLVSAYNYAVTGVDVTDYLPPQWQYAANSAIITYSSGSPSQQIEPAVSGTLAAGYTLFWDLSETIDPDQTITVTFQATPNSSAALGFNENCSEAVGQYAGNTFNPDDCAFVYLENLASVGDRLWEDLNRNGIQDPGEPGLAGLTVELHASGGALVASTTTDGSGSYLFDGVAAGDYYLLFVAPSGWAFAPQDQGGNDGLDSDAAPATGRTSVFTLTAGVADLSRDAGLFELIPAIQIEKSTNGDDADLPTGPSVPVGAAITWLYVVTNPGDVPLSSITVADNQPGVIPVYQSGDDGDNLLEAGESWIYQATGTAVAGQYVNLGTASGYYNGSPVSDDDPSHYLGGQAGIEIKKSVEGDDAETPPGPSIMPGDPVTWTYVVTNTGNVPISDVLVTDSEAGVTPAYQSGDDGDGLLEPGESWTFSATGTARAGQYVNIGSVNGTDVYSQPVSDSDVAYYFGPDPQIDIEKAVNGDDADFPMGPAIPVGQALEWRYVVTNPGNVPLSGIVVSDDRSVVPLTLDVTPPDGYNDGDTNLNNLLDPGESWIYTAAGTAAAGQYTNIGSVIGHYNSQVASDSDPCSYYGGVSGIALRKTTNGYDADNPPGHGIIVGTPVTWHYAVSNTGNTPVGSITVVDDQGVAVTPVDAAPADGYNDGDTNRNNLLDMAETWHYQGSGSAQLGDYANIGTVSGVDAYMGQAVSASSASHYFGATPAIHIVKLTNGQDANLPPGPTIIWGGTVTWQYLVINPGNVPLSNVTVTDSDPAVTPLYLLGDLNDDGLLDPDETWIYEALGSAVDGQYANTGTTAGTYDGLSVTNSDPGHYYSEIPKGRLGDLVWNDLNRNGIQDPGEPGLEGVTVELHQSDGILAATAVTNSSGIYSFDNIYPADYYLVFVPISGYAFSPVDQGADDSRDSDADPATGRTAATTVAPGEEDLSQDAGLYLLIPGIHIEKSTNGDDADLPTGPSVPVGGAISWSYIVTNSGDVPLANISVTDDQSGVIPVYASGDDGDGLLEAGESWIYQATGTAALGQYVNIGTATGDYNGQTVTDTDPSHYFGGQAGIRIKKYVNGDDAETPPGPSITPGATVTWSYVVANTGNIPVGTILVSDSEAGITPIYTSGDDGNGLLDVGESWTFAATGTARAGLYVNVGSVNGTDYYGQPVSDNDLAHYFGPDPAIRLQKLVNGDDANLPTGPAIPVGQSLVWSYLVSNAGNVPLANITVTDDQGVVPIQVDTTPADGFNDGDVNLDDLLDTGENWIYTAAGIATAGQYTNTGTVSGDFGGAQVSDDDPANYFGGYSGIDITKLTNGADADIPPGPGILIGTAVQWLYQVRNTGNTAIRDVAVSDDRGVTVSAIDVAPADGYNDGDLNNNNLLDTDEIWLFAANGTAQFGQYANVGTATGTDHLFGTTLTDNNASHYFGAIPGLNIIKRTNGQDANVPPGPTIIWGGTVTWQYIVVNTGNVPLTSVTVTDSDPGVIPVYNTGDLNNDNILDTSETWFYTATGIAVAGQYANTGMASGRYNGVTYTDLDPSHYYSELPNGRIGDLVWNDLNRNGLQDPGEPGLEGVTVELYQSNGTLTATDVTNSSGLYAFDNVIPGDYYLVFTAPAGYSFAHRDQGADDSLDSDADPATGRTATTTIAPGEEDLSQDAGLYLLVPGIHIEKSTNGDDADLPTGPSIPVGGAVNWRYEVTNTGDVPLANITVSDDQPGATPDYISGDDGDNLLEAGETWIYQEYGIAVLGQYVNIGTATGEYSGQTVSDSDPSHYFGGQAGILIKKYVNGADADLAPGPSITPGNPVTWVYLVSNTGNVAVSNVLVTDSETGITPVYADGDDGNGLLEPAETWRFSASGTARAGQYLNVGTVNATDIFGQPLNDSDPAYYFGPDPAIHLQKLINGEDANLPMGPAVPVGQPLLWSYLVTNPGNVPLAAISVSDDRGVLPQPVDTTPADGLNDGDLNLDSLLDPGETWIYTAGGTATSGQYVNIGTAAGQYNGQPVSDDDPAHYFGGFAGISITKLTNGADADNPPGPGIIVGTPVNWSYEIGNAGNTPIRELLVSDDQGVAVAAVDAAPADGYNDGDLNRNQLLDPDETWLYAGSSTAQPGQYANIGSVTGIDNFFNQPVSDQNASHYFGATPNIHIVKLTNGQDANVAPGPTVILGGAITWQYLVVNPGDVPLADVSVTDSDPAVTPLYIAGDLNNDNLLDLNETWIYEATGVAAAGPYTNTATVSGTFNGVTFSNSDPSHYFGELPKGRIGDLIWNDLNRNGVQDPGEPGLEGVAVALHRGDGTLVATAHSNSSGLYAFDNVETGSYYLIFIPPAGYGLTQMNMGSDDLSDSDAHPATGRTATALLEPGENDLGWDAGLYLLLPGIRIEKLTNGEDADVATGPSIPVGAPVTWLYLVSNTGDVALADVAVTDNQTGVTPVYVSGDDGNGLLDLDETWTWRAAGTATLGQYANLGTATGQYDGQTVSNSDPSHYFGGQAAVRIKKYVNGDDADVEPGPMITPGAAVTWSYIVTNTGNVNIRDLLVTDSETGVVPAYSSGDDGDQILAPAESWTYTAAGTARAGAYVNVGSVNAIDAYGRPVNASDLAHYFGPAPAIHIQKLVNGNDADIPPGPAVPVGQALTWSYLVTNIGNVALENITVSDDQGVTPLPVDIAPADGFNDGDLNLNHRLDIDEIWTYTASGVSTAGPYVNIGTAIGHVNGTSVSDSDPGHYFGGYAGVTITKRTNGADADAAPGPGILSGTPVLWSYEIRNSGNTPIREIAVSDDQGVTVSAVDVTPADGLNDGDLNLDGLLDVNETWLFQGQGTAVAGPYANIGTVTGVDNFFGQPVSDHNPSHYFGALPGIRIVKLTNGQEANEPPGPSVIPGGTITWQYIVVNSGNVPLSNVIVSDSDPAVIPIYNTGDLNDNGILEMDETWVYEARGTARPGQYSNTGTVSGSWNGTTTQHSDLGHYYSQVTYDFGDVLDPRYPTTLAQDGARHAISSLYLGSAVDGEADGIGSANGQGDDSDGLDDEDGVTFPNLPLIQNSVNTVQVIASGVGYLTAWIDFNNDGDWADYGEHIIVDFPVHAGLNTITFNVPLIDPSGAPATLSLYSRFRLATVRGLGFTGAAPDGEVEDYVVQTYVPVELSSFTASVRSGQVELSWITQSESENLGFILYRSESETGEYERITAQIIPGAGSSSHEHRYSYTDRQLNGSGDYWYKLADVSLNGALQYHQTLKVTVAAPANYSLEQNYPNPFNPTTSISFSLKEAGEVSLALFNLRGQRIRQLVSGQHESGFHTVVWDARDDAGQAVPSGTYLCVITVNGFTASKRMTLLK